MPWPSSSPAGSCGRRSCRRALGLFRAVTPAEAARLADRGFGFQDRVATSIEWAEHPDRTPLVDALVADTAARVEARDGRRVVARLLPREAKLVPLPLALGLVLALAPPIPLPAGGLPNFTAKSEEEEAKPADRGGKIDTDERKAAARRDVLPAGRHAGAVGGAALRRWRSHPGR